MTGQPTLWDPERPCDARWTGTCHQPATEQIRTGCGPWRDTCTRCADHKTKWARNLDLARDRIGMWLTEGDLDTLRSLGSTQRGAA